MLNEAVCLCGIPELLSVCLSVPCAFQRETLHKVEGNPRQVSRTFLTLRFFFLSLIRDRQWLSVGNVDEWMDYRNNYPWLRENAGLPVLHYNRTPFHHLPPSPPPPPSPRGVATTNTVQCLRRIEFLSINNIDHWSLVIGRLKHVTNIAFIIINRQALLGRRKVDR